MSLWKWNALGLSGLLLATGCASSSLDRGNETEIVAENDQTVATAVEHEAAKPGDQAANPSDGKVDQLFDKSSEPVQKGKSLRAAAASRDSLEDENETNKGQIDPSSYDVSEGENQVDGSDAADMAPKTLKVSDPAAEAGDAPVQAEGEDSSDNPAPEVPKDVVYEVVPGDTLSLIAERRLGDKMRWREIAEINALTDPNVIEIGQTLKLPQS